MERLIVTMTSWKARIDNVIPVIQHLFKHQTLKPDKVVINLSREEFKDCMPTELMRFAECHPKVEIHWMEGPNLRQWKKIIPTLLMYPNDMVVCIDDDWLYDPCMLEVLVKFHKAHPNNPVTVNYGYKVKGLLQHCGIGTLDKLSYYKGLETIDMVELSQNHSSDTFFTFLAHASGNDILYVGRKMKNTPFNSVQPLNKSEATSNASTQLAMVEWMARKGLIKRI